MVRLAMEASFFQKRFVVVAGKGGVGKSTVCAALGLAAARRGKKTVIAELGTREKVPLLFGKKAHGYQEREIYPGLFSINVQPDPALREYGRMKLKFEKLYEIVFENEAMKKLLKMIPGMKELFLLGKTFNMERERDRYGKPTWDMIIVDAPATGHGVSLLRLPQVILEVIKTGPMASEVRLMRALLEDTRRTAINFVTLPEEMPVEETYELQRQVDDILQIPKGYLLVNQVWPEVMKKRDREIMHILRDGTADDPIAQGAFDVLETMTKRRKLQEKYLRELKKRVAMPMIKMPFIFEPQFGFDEIETLSTHITKEAERLGLGGSGR